MVYLETGVFGRFQSPYDREDQFMSGPADIGGALCHEVAEDEFSQLILAGSKPMARSCSLSLDMMIPDLLGRCLSIGSDGITRRSVYVWGKEDKIVISKLSNATETRGWLWLTMRFHRVIPRVTGFRFQQLWKMMPCDDLLFEDSNANREIGSYTSRSLHACTRPLRRQERNLCKRRSYATGRWFRTKQLSQLPLAFPSR